MDKKYPVRLGYYVMKQIQDETGKSLGEALQAAKEKPELHETILWAALQMGAFAERTELDLKKEDMPMVLDLCFYEYLELFTSSKFFPKELTDKIEERLGKKNGKGQPKTKKKPARKT